MRITCQSSVAHLHMPQFSYYKYKFPTDADGTTTHTSTHISGARAFQARVQQAVADKVATGGRCFYSG